MKGKYERQKTSWCRCDMMYNVPAGTKCPVCGYQTGHRKGLLRKVRKRLIQQNIEENGNDSQGEQHAS